VKTGQVRVGGLTFPIHSLNTLVVGSGAAGLAAAVWLHRFGQHDVAVVTEEWGAGASRNAGSDKQTYYKLSLAPCAPDCAREMAEDLGRGGSMHGDIALVEAANSLAAFFHLVELGVPFPHDRYGSYTGYKTDNDPRQRATSAGPLSSRLMCDRLAEETRRRRIPVLDRTPIIALLTSPGKSGPRVIGAIGLNARRDGDASLGFVLFNALNVVLATGGPAGIYRSSVYPLGQTGSHGLAFEAGAVGNNLTESQFGLAALKFRWNLSGSYQQVVPRYFSTSRDGSDERDFLNPFFPDPGRLGTAIFLKGYQWPFDPNKVEGWGSSLLDLLVYRETQVLGRRVFLDYRENPRTGDKPGEFRLSDLSPEAYSYLEQCGALAPTPLERLGRINQPAIELFRGHGIDLASEPLEIGVCNQHNNGGLKGNVWWETTVEHLFGAGEVMGTHGVTRPGGSALNAGQVGAMRAALFIARRRGGRPLPLRRFVELAASQVRGRHEWARAVLSRGDRAVVRPEASLEDIRSRLDACGGIIRPPDRVRAEIPEAWLLLRRLRESLGVVSPTELASAFKCLDLCLTHCLYLEAIGEYLDRGGRSRGSFLVPDASGRIPAEGLEEGWRFSLAGDGDFVGRHILEVWLEGGEARKRWVAPRPIPGAEGWFETVWHDFEGGRIFDEEDVHGR
jgi:succinate dehydrogenase/fumarate reductase flavoprotein subunit